MERGFDLIHIVDADRNLAPAPADCPVERFLQGHDALDRFIVKRDSPNDGRTRYGADVCQSGGRW